MYFLKKQTIFFSLKLAAIDLRPLRCLRTPHSDVAVIFKFYHLFL